MRGKLLPIKQALVELVILREQGIYSYAQFQCEKCKHQCTIPAEGESKSIIRCCRCDTTNYLNNYEIVTI